MESKFELYETPKALHRALTAIGLLLSVVTIFVAFLLAYTWFFERALHVNGRRLLAYIREHGVERIHVSDKATMYDVDGRWDLIAWNNGELSLHTKDCGCAWISFKLDAMNRILVWRIEKAIQENYYIRVKAA